MTMMDKASMGDLGAAMSGSGDDPEGRMLMKCMQNGDAKGLKALIRGMVMDVLEEPAEEDEAAGPSEMDY